MKQALKLVRVGMLLAMVVWLGACASEEEKEDFSEKQLYNMAREQIDDDSYQAAIKNLELLESRYPFGPYAEQAQLELVYAHYRSFDYDAAVTSADRFIRLHPQHPNVDYAYYLRGLSNYSAGRSFFDRFFDTDMSERDPGPTRESFNDFAQLLARFPNSDYAPDAKARMVYLRNLMARHEIGVANYHFKRGAYVAALNRGKHVVENYPQTPAVSDGLAVMVQAYMLLGMDDLAQDSLKVLKENHPNYPALDESGNFITKFRLGSVDRSWTNKLTLGVFDEAEPPSFDTRPEWEK